MLISVRIMVTGLARNLHQLIIFAGSTEGMRDLTCTRAVSRERSTWLARTTMLRLSATFFSGWVTEGACKTVFQNSDSTMAESDGPVSVQHCRQQSVDAFGPDAGRSPFNKRIRAPFAKC